MELQKLIGSEIPPLIVKLLLSAGFDSKIALRELDTNCIGAIEEHTQKNRHLLLGTVYEHENQFELLPGHRKVILKLSKYVNELAVAKPVDNVSFQRPELSLILRSLLEMAEMNSNKLPKGFRYSEIIRNFATYIFLMCGRACYDTLCANLPIPKTDTIGKYFIPDFMDEYLILKLQFPTICS